MVTAVWIGNCGSIWTRGNSLRGELRLGELKGASKLKGQLEERQETGTRDWASAQRPACQGDPGPENWASQDHNGASVSHQGTGEDKSKGFWHPERLSVHCSLAISSWISLD